MCLSVGFCGVHQPSPNANPAMFVAHVETVGDLHHIADLMAGSGEASSAAMPLPQRLRLSRCRPVMRAPEVLSR